MSKTILILTTALTTLLIGFSTPSKGTVYEAEDAFLYQAATETKNSGYIGESYVNFDEIEITAGEPNFDMTGYATVSAEGLETTTGGEGGTVTTVTTLQELIDYSKTRENKTAPGILYIKGKISAASTTVISIKHGANISILGEGEFGELENIGLKIWNYKNVIVRNLKIHEVFYPDDAITIDACQHVWIDHNELYSKIGSGIGVDTYDGLLDIKNGSRYVTVSWNIIHHHMKTSLIGHTDNSNQAATDSQFKITYHHNYFHDTNGRNPSIRFGTIHLYNNYFENITDYGIAVRQGARALLKNNHYHNVHTPITTNKFNGPDGFVCESGTIYTGGTTAADNSITQVDCDFWSDLPYSYTLDPTNTVAMMVQEYGGVGIINTGNTVSLSGMAVTGGTLEPAFNTNITRYTVVVPVGIQSITITAASGDEGAIITGDGLISTIPSTAEITVTAADESSSLTYYVDIMYQTLSSNANLSTLSASTGQFEPAFDPLTVHYLLGVSEGTESVTISAETEDPDASVEGTGEYSELPATAIITVTAEDGTIKVYEVEITVPVTTEEFNPDQISIYPNPVTEILYIKNTSGGIIEVFDLNGSLLKQFDTQSGTASVDLRSMPQGIYMVKVKSSNSTIVKKIIKR
jgi:pectate lyase